MTATDWDVVEEPDFAKTLAGFESWRADVWGHAAVQALGCRILPELRAHDIYCFGADVPILVQEAQDVMDHLAPIAAATGEDMDRIRYRLQNILDAALWAQAHEGGGVVIW